MDGSPHLSSNYKFTTSNTFASLDDPWYGRERHWFDRELHTNSERLSNGQRMNEWSISTLYLCFVCYTFTRYLGPYEYYLTYFTMRLKELKLGLPKVTRGSSMGGTDCPCTAPTFTMFCNSSINSSINQIKPQTKRGVHAVSKTLYSSSHLAIHSICQCYSSQ